jgi:putative copper resistance protein D
VFWWLTHGLKQGMPAFGATLSEDDRWDLINFLRALSAEKPPRRLSYLDEPERPRLIAPDFTVRHGTGPRPASRSYRGRQPVLLVLFTLPSSRARLVQLADAFGELRSFNAAIIAVPMNGEEKILSRIGASPRILFPVATEGAGGHRLDLQPLPAHPRAGGGARP